MEIAAIEQANRKEQEDFNEQMMELNKVRGSATLARADTLDGWMDGADGCCCCRVGGGVCGVVSCWRRT